METRKLGADDPTPSQLPPWLSRHVALGFDSDDVAALVSSIDSSQNPPPSSVAQLPAEILLHILEFVPVDYVLEWRKVCRGFRDAIDGRILYYYLHRTQLIGFIGPREDYPMNVLNEEEYNKIRFLHSDFQHLERDPNQGEPTMSACKWESKYAVFSIKDSWFQTFNTLGLEASNQKVIDLNDSDWAPILLNLQAYPDHLANFPLAELKWSIKLDHAVFDLDLPLERDRDTFYFDIRLSERKIIVAWKEMLFRFLKTEAALRHMLDEKMQDSKFTFSLNEDCLREVRRRRLKSGLDLDTPAGRRHKWGLENLPKLFGRPLTCHTTGLESVESTSVAALLLLRRKSSMTAKQAEQLRQLNEDYQAMQRHINQLDEEFKKFKTLLIPTFAFAIEIPGRSADHIALDPVEWPEDLLAIISERVSNWHSQKKVINQIYTLLCSSNQALEIGSDEFEMSSQL